VVARDLADVDLEGLSADRRFAIAYNAALQSAKMVIACCGYRVKGLGIHYTTFECLKLAMGKGIFRTAKFLDACRRKRNIADYDVAGKVTEAEATEIIKAAISFSKRVENWIRVNYPSYG